MSPNEIAISVKELTKAYKNVPVLNGVSFQVSKGSIFALLGTNGAGKTTIVKILTTLLKYDSGKVSVCGFDAIREPGEIREVISLTGQNAAVDDILTGRENLSLIGRLRHIPDSKVNANVLLQQFGLTDAADRRVATYSGGMRRRLDISMSLLGSPKLLFLDEPTTGLDPQARIAVWNILKELAESGLTVFLTTQYLEEADQIADQIAILHKGNIVAQGTAAELKKRLPGGHIELRFENEQGLDAANSILNEFEVRKDKTNQTLSVSTDGSVGQLTAILGLLELEKVAVAEFAQKLPTLDDVFLSIVVDKHKEEIK
jgi:ABC-2 type transport system ATP-binding protein